MNTSSRSFRVYETICQELLARLQGDLSDRAHAFAAEAHRIVATLNAATRELPTQEERTAMIARILDLHRTAMDYLVLRDGSAAAKGS
jgi:hypothetical protein